MLLITGSFLVLFLNSLIGTCTTDTASAAAAAAAAASNSPGTCGTRPACEQKFCPMVYLPVCGMLRISGQIIYRTFGNSCMLSKANCVNPQIAYKQVGRPNASCEQQKFKNICNGRCNRMYQPICGVGTDSEGNEVYETFSNPCVFWYYNCKYPEYEYVLNNKGPC